MLQKTLSVKEQTHKTRFLLVSHLILLVSWGSSRNIRKGGAHEVLLQDLHYRLWRFKFFFFFFFFCVALTLW